MRIHLIIDFQYLFHRHLYSIRSAEHSEKELGYRKGRKRLSWVVDGQEIETSRIYYPLADLETLRRYWCQGHDVTLSICMDSKSERKSESSKYKANRQGLQDVDRDAIQRIEECLRNCGYNVYKQPGMEADDIVGTLVKLYKDKFDYTVIYTPDSDLTVHLDDNVGIMRYKSSYSKMGGKSRDVLNNHMAIGKSTFSAVMGDEYKCKMPFNTILLFKATAGDKSDGVPGISGFGVKAFDALIGYLELRGTDFESLRDPDKVEGLLTTLDSYLGSFKVQEALESLALVRCRHAEIAENEPIAGCGSQESREKAYSVYGMASLYKD